MHAFRQIVLGLGVASVLQVVAPVAPGGDAFAQSLTTGAIAGSVVGDLGDPVASARVQVTERSSGITRVIETDREGRFELSLLPAGDYDVLVEEIGLRPTHIRGVPVRLGRRVEVEVSLEPVAPPVDSVDVVQFDGAPALGANPGERWFSSLETSALPSETRELVELVRLSSTSDGGLGAEGLPARLSAVYVDGVPAPAARHPLLRAAPGGTPAYPLGAIDRATFSAGPPDVEWAGFAGGTLAAFTRSGSMSQNASAFGTWSDEELTRSTYFDGGDGKSSLQGGFRLGGSMLGDSARYLVGAEARRIDTPLWEGWADGAGFAALRSAVADSFGVPIGFDDGLGIARTEAVAAFGRFDWWATPDHRFEVRANVASLPDGRAQPFAGSTDPVAPPREGEDASLAATLASTLPDGWSNELRIGVSSSDRSYTGGDPGDIDDSPGVPTRIADGGFRLLTDAAYAGRFDHRSLHISEVVHRTFGIHRLKAGVTLDYEAFESVHTRGRTGEFIVSDTDALLAGTGVFTATEGVRPSAEFSVPRLAAFAQDRWEAAPGLEITAGLRWDLQALPRSDITPNTAWHELSGLANQNVPERISRFSPRLGFTWDVGERRRWVVHGVMGVFHDRVDPSLLAEVITRDGPLEVRRGVGTLGDVWPGPPDDATSTVVGPALTLMSPEFRPPRTGRTSLGITRSLDSQTALHLSGVYRRTEFLPRRLDLNLVGSPASHDPYGRPIYGELVKLGRVLATEPRSNRRFPDHDVVSAVSADGESSYWGVTVQLERRASEALRFVADYTYSRTRDDWFGAASGDPAGRVPPEPDGLDDGSEWADGRSDFDIPHRATAGFALRLPIGTADISVAGRYRFSSGRPFTPGFRYGVDANGDGRFGNDPAFVDDAIEGMEPLLERWSCLRTNVGAFAERNACRGPGTQALDVRVGLQLPDVGGIDTEIFAEGFGLIESDGIARVDEALYLLDPDASVTHDPGTDVTTVPLVANPRFGRPLLRRATGAIVRLGLRMAY